MYPLRLCAFCPCGPKLFREAASVLFLGAERKVKPVEEGLAPPVCAERTPKPVGTGGIRLRMISSRDFGAIPLHGKNA
jgi:hypothetical protein